MAFRYTKQQKASPFFEEYKKERARLQRFQRSAKARGITLPYDFVPGVPQKITAGSVRKLQRITPEHGYYTHAEYFRVNPETGAIIHKTGSQIAISRGISEVSKRIGQGERWVTAREANDEMDFRRWRNEVESTDYTEPEEPDYQFRPDLNDTKPEHIDTTPQDEIDDSGDYWYEDTEDEDEEEEEDSTDYTWWDSDFDSGWESDTPEPDNTTDYSKQLERVDQYIDNFIDYIGHHVSKRWADYIADAVAEVRSAWGDKAFAERLDDESFWEDLASMVQQYYKEDRKADPKPRVMSEIQRKLTGRPMTMEENEMYDDDSDEDI